MKLIYHSLFLFVILINISCKKNGCGIFTTFSDFTERDPYSTLIRNDPDDWTLKDHWDEWEMNLFDTTYKTNCVAPSNFSIVAYPNPTSGPFQLSFSKTRATKVDYRLIDDECNVIASRDDITGNAMGLQAGAIKDGIVRLYYRFVEDGCEYQGHGDIMIKL